MPSRPRTPRRGARLAALLVACGMLGGAGPAASQTAPPLLGSRGPDVLTGTPDGEYIDGRQGDDVIDGAGGADVIVAGPGADAVVAYTGAQVEAADGEVDTVRCIGGGVTVLADADDVLDPGCTPVVARSPRAPAEPSVPVADPRLAAPARTDRPLHIVYEFAGNARILHDGYPGVSGLSTQSGSHRQHPLGDPFPATRWIGKVNHREMTGRSAAQIAALLRSRMDTSSIGGADPQGSLVGVDEVGRELQDDGIGPRFLAAMRILSRQRHPVTGEPLSRRVVLYVAPKMVSNIGARNDREDWDSTMAAARLAGAVYLQMYHATAGRVTGPATAREWRDYPAVWRSEMGASAGRLRFMFSGVGPQDTQWRNAASTEAGRRTLRSGAGAYRLGSAANARAWLRNWNRYVVGRASRAPAGGAAPEIPVIAPVKSRTFPLPDGTEALLESAASLVARTNASKTAGTFTGELKAQTIGGAGDRLCVTAAIRLVGTTKARGANPKRPALGDGWKFRGTAGRLRLRRTFVFEKTRCGADADEARIAYTRARPLVWRGNAWRVTGVDVTSAAIVALGPSPGVTVKTRVTKTI